MYVALSPTLPRSMTAISAKKPFLICPLSLTPNFSAGNEAGDFELIAGGGGFDIEIGLTEYMVEAMDVGGDIFFGALFIRLFIGDILCEAHTVEQYF